MLRIALLLILALFTGTASALVPADITSHKEIFDLGKSVAARSKFLFDNNASDGRGVGFSYACIYFDALCIEATPNGQLFDMRIVVDSTMVGHFLLLCTMSGDYNLVKCKSWAPPIRLFFQKSGDAWTNVVDELLVLGRGYGTTFGKSPICNKRGCEN